MRFRLRTLLIVLALAPPVLGIAGPHMLRTWKAWRKEQLQQAELRRVLEEILADTAKNGVPGDHY